MQPIPTSLAPFFQEYDLAALDPQKDAHTIIECALQFGNRAELRWLFSVYSQEQIAAWVRQFGKEKLPQPHRAFWQIVLDVTEINTVKGNHSMTTKDIRWIQRFNNFSKALDQLGEFVEQTNLNKFEKQGFIKAFEYTYELAWNTIKDYFEAQGEVNILGSRDAFRLAFQRGLIENGETWMDMIASRIATSHTYNEDAAEQVTVDVESRYYDEFVKLHEKLTAFKKEEE